MEFTKEIVKRETNLGGFIEKHLPEDVVINLNAGHGCWSLLVALADHDGVGGQDLGLLAADVERDRVDETLWVDLVVVNGAAIPHLLSGLIVDVSKVAKSKKQIQNSRSIFLQKSVIPYHFQGTLRPGVDVSTATFVSW